jgi:hypothetical protein
MNDDDRAASIVRQLRRWGCTCTMYGYVYDGNGDLVDLIHDDGCPVPRKLKAHLN